jgi:hypothetical protein
MLLHAFINHAHTWEGAVPHRPPPLQLQATVGLPRQPLSRLPLESRPPTMIGHDKLLYSKAADGQDKPFIDLPPLYIETGGRLEVTNGSEE